MIKWLYYDVKESYYISVVKIAVKFILLKGCSFTVRYIASIHGKKRGICNGSISQPGARGSPGGGTRPSPGGHEQIKLLKHIFALGRPSLPPIFSKTVSLNMLAQLFFLPPN